MLGPAYAMLQPDFREMRREVRARSGSIRSILISFGGADADNLTGRALAAFLGLHRADVHVDVVVGTANPWGPSLREQSAGCSNVTIHTALPALVVTQADNQRPIAEAISDHRLARWLGDASTVTEEDFAAAMRELLEQDLAPDWSRRCLAVVDGRGVDRVAAALLLTRETALRVRPVTESDEALLLEWANDRLTRQNAFSSAPISASEHQEWFRRRLGDSDGCRIYIAETLDGVPVGQVRFDHRLADWRISYALAPQFRGQRLGRRLLDLGIRELARAEEGATLVAEVKGSNEASRRVFDSLGFTSTRIDEDVIVYRRSASPT
jgi:RimJ/RimL family protein N-acetyltransferase